LFSKIKTAAYGSPSLAGSVAEVKVTLKSPSGASAGLIVKLFDGGEVPGEHLGLEPFQGENGTKSDTIKKECLGLDKVCG
jgi:hypothetical protein